MQADDNVLHWLKGRPKQNFGDYLSAYFMARLFEPVPVAAQAIHLVGSVISDSYVRRAAGAPDLPVIFWGCGMRGPGSLAPGLRQHARFLGVRGPLTRDALGLPASTPLGDPGLLLPLLHAPRPDPRFAGRSLCIPHFHDPRPHVVLLAASGCDAVLRPAMPNRLEAIEALLDAIAAADFVLSASLHGAIEALAYGRPFGFWDSGHGDGIAFKWKDFSASVAMPCVFSADLAEARQRYARDLLPAILVPPLGPLLAAAPFPLRRGYGAAAGALGAVPAQRRSSSSSLA